MKAMTTDMRLEDLERRVAALEAVRQQVLWGGALAGKLVEQYGEHVDKSTAAKILGVTRATVYVMLADGRISGACEGRRVSVRSIAAYLSAQTKEET